jgi:hypothetical protein
MKLKSILNTVATPSSASRARAVRPLVAIALAALALLAAAASQATDTPPAADVPSEIKVEHGRFEPIELVVPEHMPFKIRVTNGDAAAIEFESFELHRERVVQPGETVTVYVPSLSPGTYKFFDDFHSDTPEGAIVVK